jgi:hypothetical protein
VSEPVRVGDVAVVVSRRRSMTVTVIEVVDEHTFRVRKGGVEVTPRMHTADELARRAERIERGDR